VEEKHEGPARGGSMTIARSIACTCVDAITHALHDCRCHRKSLFCTETCTERAAAQWASPVRSLVAARKNQPQAEKSGRAGRQQRRSQANTQTS
jgi:hypothetical protein